MRALAIAAALLALTGAAPAMAQAKRAAAPRWTETVTRTPEGGYRLGNPNAPVKLVEYGARSCPICARFAREAMAPMRSEWIASGKLSYEFRDYLVHGAPDFALALLNQCVAPSRFFPTLEALFANQQAFIDALMAAEKKAPAQVEGWQNLPPGPSATRFAEAQGMIAFMKTRGLPEAAARKCLADPALIRGIATVNAGAERAGIQGTPTFFVNGRRVRAVTWDQLQPELRAAEG